jgi:hypothetical protein
MRMQFDDEADYEGQVYGTVKPTQNSSRRVAFGQDRMPVPAPLLDGKIPKVLKGQMTVEEVVDDDSGDRSRAVRPARAGAAVSQRQSVQAAVASKLSRRPKE